jgi:small subunit ribosomal protein S16
MVKIRLRRMGAKKAPFLSYRGGRLPLSRDGRFIEEIGTYDPKAHPAELKVWMWSAPRPGSRPAPSHTETVKSLLKKAGV